MIGCCASQIQCYGLPTPVIFISSRIFFRKPVSIFSPGGLYSKPMYAVIVIQDTVEVYYFAEQTERIVYNGSVWCEAGGDSNPTSTYLHQRDKDYLQWPAYTGQGLIRYLPPLGSSNVPPAPTNLDITKITPTHAHCQLIT